ncbi:hypothetical protein T440DRAFT_217778 [Plenodomus tracheiphilus IPT5]|uniref:Uncharacterized protein n=1 Tax=Plenodomus tracheiphilus IPT5 TaxID=1408161 RepID=A0A6A7AV03_9PLEO|nr:hypothetical protein T440DRAFT_217778 [Plenodomus tracheiphilus IPT5]
MLAVRGRTRGREQDRGQGTKSCRCSPYIDPPLLSSPQRAHCEELFSSPIPRVRAVYPSCWVLCYVVPLPSPTNTRTSILYIPFFPRDPSFFPTARRGHLQRVVVVVPATASPWSQCSAPQLTFSEGPVPSKFPSRNRGVWARLICNIVSALLRRLVPAAPPAFARHIDSEPELFSSNQTVRASERARVCVRVCVCVCDLYRHQGHSDTSVTRRRRKWKEAKQRSRPRSATILFAGGESASAVVTLLRHSRDLFITFALESSPPLRATTIHITTICAAFHTTHKGLPGKLDKTAKIRDIAVRLRKPQRQGGLRNQLYTLPKPW